MSSGGRRIEGDVERGEPFEFLADGEPVSAYPGETVAAALLAAGRRRTRATTRCGEPRGLYCGMGVCFECIMVVDGRRTSAPVGHRRCRACGSRPSAARAAG
jgi:hypothetical protein